MHPVRRTSHTPVRLALVLLGLAMAPPVHAGDSLRAELDRFSQVLFSVQNNYVETPDDRKLIQGAIDGMLKTLDPHSVFVADGQDGQAENKLREDEAGIGISFVIRDSAIIVISRHVGSPAAHAGILPGDQIVALDGRPLAGHVTNDAVLRLLHGPEGSRVKLTIRRHFVPEPLYFVVQRIRIPTVSVPYSYLIRPGVGYIRIVRFAQSTGAELQSAIRALRAQGMTSLLLDLRSNPGGLLNQAVDVLDQLVPADQKVLYTRGRIQSANADYFSTDRKEKWTEGPLVVLVDHETASASEVVSGAIQDLDRGLLAGVSTFGNGLVQNQIRLSGGKLLLTVARFYTPSGRCIQRDFTSDHDAAGYWTAAFQAAVPSDSALATRPQFKTASGRKVYGGGGIYPDVVLWESQKRTPLENDIVASGVLFDHAARLTAQRGQQAWTLESLARDRFTLADAEWTGLRDALEAKGIRMDDSLWSAERPFMIHEVRLQLARRTLGALECYRIETEDDMQLARALELFPLANQLKGR